MRFLILTAAIIAACACAPAHVASTPGEWEPRPPSELSQVLLLNFSSGAMCLGFPTGPKRIHTAYHCLSGSDGVAHYKGASALIDGLADVAWLDSSGDVATLAPRTTLDTWLLFSESPPRLAQRLWWKVVLPDDTTAPTLGFYLGKGDPKEMLIWGLVERGTSGSPVIGEDGRVYGLVGGAQTWNGEFNPGVPHTPAVFASVLYGGKK